MGTVAHKQREDPESVSRSPNSGLDYSYGVEYRTPRWIYLLDPPKGPGKQGPSKPKGFEMALLSRFPTPFGRDRPPDTSMLSHSCSYDNFRSFPVGVLTIGAVLFTESIFGPLLFENSHILQNSNASKAAGCTSL